MSTMSKDDDVGGAKRPSEVSGEGVEAISLIARLAVANAVDFGGSPASVEEQKSLLREADRSKVLLDLVVQVRPYGALPGPWMKWLEGGSFPVPLNLSKPVESNQRASRILDTTERGIARAQRKIDAAQADLQAGIEEMRAARLVNAATLHWTITEQLGELMRGTFAMGPAWTLMRALSGFVPQDSASVATMSPALLADYKVAQEVRANETEMMMVALDLWCGDAEFESSLRYAIKGVVREYQVKEEARIASGAKRRPIKMVRSTMRPTAESEVAGVMVNLAAE